MRAELGGNVMKAFTKAIRIITLAPIMALATLLTLFFVRPEVYGEGMLRFWLAIGFLVVFPLLGYPCQPLVPGFKGRGREGQRNLAMVFALVGYVLGCVVGIFLKTPESLWIVYLDYLISGLIIVVLNKLCGIRASAHACGIAGPAVLLAYLGVPLALLVSVPIFVGAFWASIKMKRHTWPQFTVGAIVPLVVLGVLHVVFLLF